MKDKMGFSYQQLVELVERASTLAERLGPAFQPKAVADNERRINTRLEQWRQVCAYGDQDKFERRLAWDGLDLEQVSPFLGAVRWVSEQPLPAWTKTLQAALRQAQETPQEAPQDTTLRQDAAPPAEVRPRYLEPEIPLPFEELLVPFVEVARQTLLNRSGSAYNLLSGMAHEALERNLIAELSSICALTFNLEFSIFRMLKNPGGFQPWVGSNGVPGRALYQEFVREMLDGKLLTFFQSYSVLARLAATLTDFWIDANLEFLQRLAADWPDIQQTFQAEGKLGQVVMVQPALSDRHHRGRRVIALKFDTGLKLVYKPRSLGLEAAYFQLLAWFNEQGTPLPFKILEVLERGTHGWVEYIAPNPCQDEAEASRYYRRAGMLLAILYTIEATDCHFQNIIACGEQPVLIDVEGLMQHQVRWPTSPGDQATDAQVLARQRLLDSVLRTSFLPRWEFGPNGQEAYDLSGLGAVGEQALNWQTTRLYQVNTDGMALVHEAGAFESYANAPLTKEVDLTPEESSAFLVAGFEEMYRFLMAHRAGLLASEGPLSIFARQRTRLILRNTRGYEAILRKSIQPNFLRDGAERSLQLDILSRWMLSFGQQPACWPLLALEQQALANLDIPHFSAPAGSDALPMPAGPDIEKFFIQASYERVLTRLECLGEADLERQLEYIEAALYTRLASDPHSRPSKPDWDNNTHSPANGKDTYTGRRALIQQAVSLAAWLHGKAITTAGGHSAAWIGLQYTPEVERYQLQPLSYDLYSGGGGIALFLAGLARLTGEKSYHQAALSAVHPLRQVLYDLTSPEKIAHPEQVIKGIGLGGASGVGSFLYVLTQVGQLLAEPGLLAEARQAATFVSPELIAADERFDVMMGAAGMILSLLSLYRASGDKTVLAQAAGCGRHLLDKRVASPTGQRSWPALQGKFLTGFAHGAAGIAYALLRLSEEISKVQTAEVSKTSAVSPAALREAAVEAIAYERHLFSPEHGNWPDLRKTGPEAAFGLGWCHGAPGIGLARLGGLAGLDTPEVRQDIAVALQTTQQAGLAGVDHLCCGNLGRLELLLVAACQLSYPELRQTAQQQATQIVARARQKGAFSLSTQPNLRVYHPGFFQGVAGIGYGLLRLAEPELLPSVLLWA